MGEACLIFAPAASRALGDRIASSLGDSLAALEEREFEDGEHKARPLCSVRGADTFVVHSLYGDARQSANDKLVRLLFLVGALKDAGAARVTAVVPYLAYARKDRKSKPRDPVSTRYAAQLFEAVGTDRIVALDVHNLAAYQNAFRCCAEHLEAAPLFVRELMPVVGDEPLTVVSPDSGGIKRADEFRRRLCAATGRTVAFGFAEKHRSGGVVSGDGFAGDVDGRTVIIVDDLISTGTTMARVAAACRARGARRVYAVATHGLFAAAANSTLREDAFDRIFVTDSVPPIRVTDAALAAKIAQVGVAPLLAEAISRLHGHGSLVDLAEG